MLKNAKTQSGFTLLEVIISAVILAVVIGTTLQIIVTTQPMVNTSLAKQEIEDKGRRILDTIVKDVRNAFRNTMQPDTNTTDTGPVSEILFQPILGFADTLNTNPALNGFVSYRTEDNPDDPENGVDDDGNGLVDEQILIREVTDNGGNVNQAVLAKNVQRGSFQVERLEARITFSITLLRQDPGRPDIIHQANLKTNTFLFNVDGNNIQD